MKQIPQNFNWKRLLGLPALACIVLAAGCTSTSTSKFFPAAGPGPIKVESEPAGADVYVMGEKIGVTPLLIRQQDVFPNLYPKEKQSVYGRVTLKKAGCADFTRTVSTEISEQGLLAKLDCKDINPVMSVPSRKAGRDEIDQRLEKLKELLNKGLITEDEAKRARERILDEL